MKAYTLKKKKNTEECHLFEGDFITDKTCNTHKVEKSICKKMSQSESEENIFTCYTDNQARKKIAEIGRQVCGVCTSHLYTTY